MNRYQAAERIALAIYHHGWGSLSDSEASVMNDDEEFSDTVHALLQKYRRARMLKTDDKAVRVTDPFEGLLAFASAQWELVEIAREAQLWGDRATRRTVLEVKEWPVELFHNAVNMGGHQMVFQQPVVGDHEEILTRCQDVLTEYNCPDDQKATFDESARASLKRYL